MLERFSVFFVRSQIGLRTLSSRTSLDELHLTGELEATVAINPGSHQRPDPTERSGLGSP